MTRRYTYATVHENDYKLVKMKFCTKLIGIKCKIFTTVKLNTIRFQWTMSVARLSTIQHTVCFRTILYTNNKIHSVSKNTAPYFQ